MSSTWLRRSVSVPVLFLLAFVLVAAAPLWVPLAAIVDLARGRRRLPVARLLAFALCWSWLEVAGVVVAGFLWIAGRRRDLRSHYALQRWWARSLIRALRLTVGLSIEVDGADLVDRGPWIALCRHASLADSLVTAWVFGSLAHLDPRYVLKKELALDPCLDIVGHRLPNWFVDRESARVARELEGIERMASGLGPGEVAVIFPEGTRTSPAKLARALERLRSRAPRRAERLDSLVRLLPPHSGGASALLAAVPEARILTLWHTGFDGLDRFGGILRAIASGPVRSRVAIEVHDRTKAGTGEAFMRWLDDTWVRMDRSVEAALAVTVASDTGGRHG